MRSNIILRINPKIKKSKIIIYILIARFVSIILYILIIRLFIVADVKHLSTSIAMEFKKYQKITFIVIFVKICFKQKISINKLSANSVELNIPDLNPFHSKKFQENGFMLLAC